MLAEPTRPRRSLAPLIRRYPWALVGAGVVAFSTVLVLWAKTRPGYDPYGWLVWGYQTLHLSLDLGGAPSWKPLPLLFTAPYSLFGHYALWLWMVTAVSIGLAGAVFAGRIAYRVVAADSDNRFAAFAGAMFAGAALIGIQDSMNLPYMHYVLSVQSDPMIVTFILAAIDFHLSGRRRWVIAMLVLASLGRPETWPFLGLYALWCWREYPEMRRFIVIALLIVPIMWFGIPTITNGRPLVAGQLAERSPRELHQNKIVGVADRFKALMLLPGWIAAVLAVGWAYYRRRRFALALVGGIAIWLVVEIAFALHGWPAVPRYVFEPAAVAVVLSGIAIGWLLTEIPERLKLPRWSGALVAGALTVAMIPSALSHVRTEHRDLTHERARTKVINQLATFIDLLGGRRQVLACGRPVLNVEFVSVMSWLTHMNVGLVGHRPNFELHQKYPIVLFTTLPNGWAAYPWHTAPSMTATCDRMKALYIFTSHHPHGVLVPNRQPPTPT